MDEDARIPWALLSLIINPRARGVYIMSRRCRICSGITRRQLLFLHLCCDFHRIAGSSDLFEGLCGQPTVDGTEYILNREISFVIMVEVTTSRCTINKSKLSLSYAQIY